ncbi:MAG: tetratricopeptide repeat protein [Candidatus Sulfotelmatobacter sp.]
MNSWPRILAWSMVLLVGVGAMWRLSAKTGVRASWSEDLDAAGSQVTFNRDIAPIIFRSCSTCHHPGEAGPFSLLTYSEVKKHARQIANVTKARSMPPWLPEPQALKFADDLRLPASQIDLIQQWVAEGEVEGDAADLPPQPKFIEGWRLGVPDLILKAERPYILPAQGTDSYWNFIFRVPIGQTRWVKAIEIDPGDKRYVHHANILVDRGATLRKRESEPGAGFGGMEIRIESQTFDPDSHLLFWKPGTVPYFEPAGMALRLDKGTDLILNTHMQPSGKPEVIQPTIGIYFTAQPATKFPMLLQLENDVKLDIPAGQKDFVVTDKFTLPVDVDILAIYPHAHYLGKDLQASAILPDGTRETLIHIPHWNLNWQAVYRYAEPVILPKGSTVELRYVYDNSDENAMNPSHPPVGVRAGNRSTDEMCHLWLQVLPVNTDPRQGDPRMELQEAMARHNLEKNPADFEAHYNLAAMLQARNKLHDARREYEFALGIRPEDAAANNAMGSVLLASRQPRDAVTYLTRALKSRPDYFDALYNLGNALASQNDFVGASEQFELALKVQPNDADAEANLGSALAEMGDFSQAKLHFERALQINPNHALAKENLQQLEGARSK